MATASRATPAKAAIDWIKVKSIFNAKDFAVVSEQRARHLELTRILATPTAKLDMAHYKSVLANQEVVQQVEAALKAFAPVKADPSGALKSLDSQEAEALSQARQTVDHVKQTVSGFKRDLDGIKNVQHFDHLTPDVVYAAAPGLEKQYHDRLRKGQVFHEDHNFGEKFFG